jgi:hypothetical protein
LHRLAHRRRSQKGNDGHNVSKSWMAVVDMANETNRLAAGYQLKIDEQFLGTSLK